MKGSLSVIGVCIVMGIIYGKLATIYHWHLPPNWLANMMGVHNVETRIDLAYASLYVDAALLGAVLSIIIRLVTNKAIGERG